MAFPVRGQAPIELEYCWDADPIDTSAIGTFTANAVVCEDKDTGEKYWVYEAEQVPINFTIDGQPDSGKGPPGAGNGGNRLVSGIHELCLRAKGVTGDWTRVPFDVPRWDGWKVDKGEWFLDPGPDPDPPGGSGTALPLLTCQDLANDPWKSTTLDLPPGTASGVHTIGFRVGDSEGVWGATSWSSVLVAPRPAQDPEVLSVRVTAVPNGFLRGDTNQDDNVNIADAVCLLGYLFGSLGTACKEKVAECEDAADANDDGDLNIADAVTILGHLFAETGPLPGPFEGCGSDPTPDILTCCHFPSCYVTSANVSTDPRGEGTWYEFEVDTQDFPGDEAWIRVAYTNGDVNVARVGLCP
jgi:hypothetical protein